MLRDKQLYEETADFNLLDELSSLSINEDHLNVVVACIEAMQGLYHPNTVLKADSQVAATAHSGNPHSAATVAATGGSQIHGFSKFEKGDKRHPPIESDFGRFECLFALFQQCCKDG